MGKIARINVHGRDRVEVTEYDSLEAAQAAIDADRASADADTKSWQRTVAPGDHVLFHVGPGQFEWAEVLGSDDPAYLPPATVRLARIYRRAKPDGEVGTFHCCSLHGWVAPVMFEAARKAKWPGEGNTLAVEILRAAGPINLTIHRHRV